MSYISSSSSSSASVSSTSAFIAGGGGEGIGFMPPVRTTLGLEALGQSFVQRLFLVFFAMSTFPLAAYVSQTFGCGGVLRRVVNVYLYIKKWCAILE